MSESGYFSLPRSLTRSKEWYDLSLINQKIFQVLVDHACFKPYKFDDHGHIFELQPGQYCGSYAEIKGLCGKEISIIQVERAIKKLILLGFLMQEVRWRKSIITITHKDTYDLILNQYEVKNEVNLRQTRGKLEVQKKKVKKVKKVNTIITDDLAAVEKNENFSIDLNGNSVITDDFGQHNIYNQTTNSEENQTKSEIKRKKPNKVKTKVEEERRSFGEDGLVKLTEKEYADLLKHMKEQERAYWIQEVSLARGENQQAFDKKYKSHYHVILKWKRYRENHTSTSTYQKNTSVKDKILEKLKHGQSYNGFECCIDSLGIGFKKDNHYFGLKFTDSGFLEQLNLRLEKMGAGIRIA